MTSQWHHRDDITKTTYVFRSTLENAVDNIKYMYEFFMHKILAELNI